MKKLSTDRIKKVFINFPMVITSAILLFLVTVNDDLNLFNNEEIFAIIFLSAIPLFLGLRILSIKVGYQWSLRLMGINLLAVYYLILPSEKADLNEITAYYVIPITILLHLFVAVAPFMGKVRNQNMFWNYNKNLFVNVLFSLIFSMVLAIGLSSVIVTCNELFELSIDRIIYERTFSFIFIIGFTIIFLLFYIKDCEENKSLVELPVVLKFFTQFVLIPIMLLYTLVLYAYGIKILIIWQLPEGWLSYAIITYSIVGILALLLVFPLRNETKKSWVKWFYNLFYYSLIPLLLLLFVAIYARISQYGITEPRYYVLLIAIWLTTVTMYYILFKKAKISFIPKSLIAFIIFSLAFPYLNAFQLSIHSQTKGIVRLLETNDLLNNNTLIYTNPVTADVLEELNEKMKFLENRNKTEALLNYIDLPKEMEINKIPLENIFYSHHFTNVIKKEEDFDNYNSSDRLYIRNNENLISIDEDKWIWYLMYDTVSTITIQGDKVEYTNQYDKDIKIVINDSLTYDIKPMIHEFAKKNYSQYYIRDNEVVLKNPIMFMLDTEKYIFKIYYSLVSYNKHNNVIDTNDSFIYIEEK
ncbi:MAG: DUF4153 domain-containing protein [Weeksellaceae bacterium]